MKSISILGIYVADLAFFGKSIPVAGETVLGENYVIGPGGKGSNQAVASAKAGGKTYFISKIGDDQFGSMARKIYEEAGVDYSKVIISSEHSTGAAGILVDQKSGKNAINVVPGAAGALTKDDVDQAADVIKNSQVFLTQLEVPREVVFHALKIAKENNVITVLNPAPAASIDKEIFPLIDYFTPNETEALRSVAISSAAFNFFLPCMIAWLPLIFILAPILFNSGTCINLFSKIFSVILEIPFASHIKTMI